MHNSVKTKVCTKCNLEKEENDFFLRSSSSGKRHAQCKECHSQYQKSDKFKNQRKLYRQTEPYKAARKKRYNTESYKKFLENYQKTKKYQEYQRSPGYRELVNKNRRRKNKSDPQYRLSIVLRSRLISAISSNQRAGSAIRDLGCTVEELKIHLEKQFQPGMTWENHGRASKILKTWHIDHILPLYSFDLSDREQFLTACHYTNLQPMWAIDNIKKGKKLIQTT